MASDAAPREGESRLHELLEKTIQAVTKLNDSIVGLSESQSHAGHRRSIQAEQPNHDRPPASSNRESPDRVSRGTSRRTMTSSGIPPPASSDPNGMLEMGPSKADLTSQNAAGAATMPIIVLDSSSEGSTLGSEYDHSDTEDTLLELITFTSEVGITRITGVDLKDNVKVTLDLDQVPEVVRRLALQVVVNAAAKNNDFSWFSAQGTCVRSACLGRRSKWHPTAQQSAACQTCSNTRNVCLGVDKDDQGKLSLRLRPLASQFRGGAALHDPKSWVLPVDNGKRTLTRYREWRQGHL